MLQTVSMQTPRSTIRALFDAVNRRDWAAAAALTDLQGLEVWHRDERAALANVLAPLSPEDSKGTDASAVTDILLQNASAELRIPTNVVVKTIGEIASLPARDYLVRLWETLDHMFGRPEPKAPPFEITGETPQNDGSVRVHYRGYLGIGGGMPESLDTRRAPDGWRCIVVPELTTPSFAILVAWRGVVR